jgi:ribosomal protein L1
MTKLEEAVAKFSMLDAQHLHPRLSEIIQLAREEEQAKFTKLVELAKSIAQVSMKEPEHCKKGPCSDSSGCICGCKGCRP